MMKLVLMLGFLQTSLEIAHYIIINSTDVKRQDVVIPILV